MSNTDNRKYKRQSVTFSPVCARWMEIKVTSGFYTSQNEYINELIRRDLKEAVEADKVSQWIKSDGLTRESVLDAFEGVHGMPEEARRWLGDQIMDAAEEIKGSGFNSVGKTVVD